ncbi:MAG TPA: hypothetical protein VE621_03555, partial [Bryobacteraceae bacterium]|nr:hypothetical protein [Bryobacteraceae bacterium]
MRTLLTVIASIPLMFGQNAHDHHAAPNKPVLLDGLGAHTHKIQTKNPEAQKFFNQGLVMLMGFNRPEALRSFQKAAELDPTAVMPHWGIAMATGPHINMDIDGDVDLKAGCIALDTARKLQATSELEAAYIRAAATRCPEYDPARYIAAMKALSSTYPDDLDAATFYAESIMVPVRWRWWSRDGKPAEGMDEAVSVLESVMRRDAQHPGANHFYIHAVEMSPSPERAVPSAQRLMGVVPTAGHLVHMPGHIWMILGRYDLVIDSNERAAEVDEAYMRKTGMTATAYSGYYVHNLHFIAVGHQMQGRREEARKSAERLAKAAEPHIESMAMMVDAFVPYRYFAALRFSDWKSALELPKPDARLKTTTALWHYMRAVTYGATREHTKAQQEQQQFEAARKEVPSDWPWLNNKASEILAVAAEVLQARVSFAKPETALEHWRRAVALEDALVYEEPPAFYYPIRESLGAELFRAKRY